MYFDHVIVSVIATPSYNDCLIASSVSSVLNLLCKYGTYVTVGPRMMLHGRI